MKYRIVEYSDGNIIIEAKRRWYKKWQACYIGPLNLERAKEIVHTWANKPKVTKKVHKC